MNCQQRCREPISVQSAKSATRRKKKKKKKRRSPFYDSAPSARVISYSLFKVVFFAFALTESKGVDDIYKTHAKSLPQDSKEVLTRGHMNPMEINSFDVNHMRATFRLPNAVPQYTRSNTNWNIYERLLSKYAQENCGPRGGTLYALTGPSSFGLADQLAESVMPGPIRVVIPVSVWTAACCVWPGGAESVAAMINNQIIQSKVHLTQMSLLALEDSLTAPGAASANLFPGDKRCRENSVNPLQ